MKKLKNNKVIIVCNNCRKILKDVIPIQRYNEKKRLQHFCCIDCLEKFLKKEEKKNNETKE